MTEQNDPQCKHILKLLTVKQGEACWQEIPFGLSAIPDPLCSALSHSAAENNHLLVGKTAEANSKYTTGHQLVREAEQPGINTTFSQSHPSMCMSGSIFKHLIEHCIYNLLFGFRTANSVYRCKIQHTDPT